MVIDSSAIGEPLLFNSADTTGTRATMHLGRTQSPILATIPSRDIAIDLPNHTMPFFLPRQRLTRRCPSSYTPSNLR